MNLGLHKPGEGGVRLHSVRLRDEEREERAMYGYAV
jgi:hypothetical protein